MGNHILIWIGVAIIVLFGVIIWKLSQKFIVGPALKDKDATLGTPLSAFREASASDILVGAAARGTPESISKAYEEMCVLRPETYYLDPRIDAVIKQYKDLLVGKILDFEAKHIPSEILQGRLNPDYQRYLRTQVRVLQKAGKDVAWFKKELSRVNKIDKEELYEADFIIALEKMGAPEYFVTSMLAGGRMEAYAPEDWKVLIEQLKKYEETYHPAEIIAFLEHVTDKEILLDETKMDAYSKLRTLGIEERLAAAYLESDVSEEDLESILDIMIWEDMSSEEALRYILEQKKAELTKDVLRETYRRKVASK